MKLEQMDYLSVTEVDLSQEIVALTSCRENEATAKTLKSSMRELRKLTNS